MRALVPAIATCLVLATGAPAAGAVEALAGTSRVAYSFGGQRVELIRYPKRALTVSADCLAASAGRKCAALRALEQAPALAGAHAPKAADRGFADQVRARAELCRGSGGRVVKGELLPSGGDNGFCLYGDGSLLDLGSLASAARAR
jgi:hypothetical protein